jgi:arylsulfatase
VAQEIVPFPRKPSGGVAGRTIQESAYSPVQATRRLRKDAPNIMIVLIDDVGPGQSSAFGGEIATPTIDRIAREGIAYNRFRTIAMCSPTRASSLLRGHSVGSSATPARTTTSACRASCSVSR